jgi:hypothetical protein
VDKKDSCLISGTVLALVRRDRQKPRILQTVQSDSVPETGIFRIATELRIFFARSAPNCPVRKQSLHRKHQRLCLTSGRSTSHLLKRFGFQMFTSVWQNITILRAGRSLLCSTLLDVPCHTTTVPAE